MHHRRFPPPNMCDRTSRFWIYTTVISLLWGHFGIWTSPAGTRFYCWILPMFTLLLLCAFFQPSIHSFLFVGHAFKLKTFFRLSFIVNFEFLTHLFLMLLDDAILFKLLKYFTFSVYFVHKSLRSFWNFQKSLLAFSYQSNFKITFY